MTEPGGHLSSPPPRWLVPVRSISGSNRTHGAALVMGWYRETAGRSRHPGLVEMVPGSGDCPGTNLSSLSPSPHLFFSPFLPKVSAGFLPPQSHGMQGEAAANQESFNFVPIPWHREGRKAAVLLIGINTVTSYLLLPNEETWSCSRHLTGKLLVLNLGEGLESTCGTCN